MMSNIESKESLNSGVGSRSLVNSSSFAEGKRTLVDQASHGSSNSGVAPGAPLPRSTNDLVQRVGSTAGEKNPPSGDLSVEQSLQLALRWSEYNGDLGGRAGKTVPILLRAISDGSIERGGELQRLVNAVVEPIKSQKADRDKEAMQASQALAELDYAAQVVGTQKLALPLVLGAKGEIKQKDQKKPIPEESHGKLPPLDVPNMEVDSYYLNTDGVLHADEVKDTPGALADKAKDGGQIGRQVAWLQTSVKEPSEVKEKQVAYFVRAEGPKFDSVLSAAVIDNLGLIEKHQRSGLKFLDLAGSRFAHSELKGMYEDALAWLKASKQALDRQHVKFSEAIPRYFGTLSATRKSLSEGPLRGE
jgi:hypothetical protein